MKIEHKTINKSHVFLLIVILSILIAAGGYFYYRHQADIIHEEKYNELKAIATLKINQLVQWRNERIADARIISRSPFFIRGVEKWFNKKTDIKFKTDIVKRLTLPQKEYGYESIYLVSTDGEPLLSVGKVLHRFDSVAVEFIKNTIKHDSIVCSDFYYCKIEKTIHYDVIAPLKNEKDITMAVLVLRINPYNYLYPFIQSWPIQSKSSETLIIRREGESVLFLNDLRFRTGAALSLKIPLIRKDIPAVQSVLGGEGIFEGKDYRGVDVLSDIRHIPGTTWSMVAKVDRDEIFADLRTQAIIIIVFASILMLVCGIGLMWIYHYRQRNIYQTLWQTQEEFRTTLYSIGDAVITSDKKGKVQHLNAVAEKLTGWNEKNARNKPNEEVFHIINEDTRMRVDNPVQLVLKEGHIVGLANHTLLISKDGRETPIADSGSPIRNEDGEIVGVVLVFRDQTEERASQKLLQDSETRYRRLFEAARDGILILDAETGLIVDVNPFLIEMLGYTHDQFLGKKVWNLGFFKDIVANEEKFSELQQKEYIRYEDLPFETSDGRKLDVEFVSNIYLVDHHKVIQCNIRDITDRKHAEEALRESERKFRHVFEASNVGKSMTLPTGEINVNDAFCKMLGYTAGELKNKKWQDLTPADEIGDTQKIVNTLLNGEKSSARFNKRYIKKDGSYIYADVSVAMLRDDKNKPLHFITTVIDITERKQADEMLKESARKLTEVQKMAQLGNWIWDVRTGNVEWSDEVFKIFRLDPKEFTPHIDSILELSPWPEDHERDKELIRKAMESHEKGNYEQRFLRPDKSVGYYYSTFEGQYDTEGNLIAIIGTVQDITEQKNADNAIRESELKFRQTFDSSPVGIVMVGLDKRFIHCNQAFSKSLGYVEEDLKGKTIEDITYPEDKNIGMAEMKAMMKGEIDTSHVQKRYLSKDGHIVWGELTISIVRDTEKLPQYFIAVIQDITMRKEMEEKLINSKQLLAETGAVGKVGGWTFNIDTLEQTWTEETYHIHELDLSFKPTVENGINFYTPASKPIIKQAVQRAIEFGEPWNLDLEIRTAKGNIRKVNAIGKADLKNRTIYGFFQDITERKQMELALNKSQTQILSVMNSTDDMIWSVDPKRFGLQTFNQKLKQYFKNQLNIDCQIGMTPEELLPADFAVQWHEIYKRALREGSFTMEYNTSSRIDIWMLTVNIMKQGDEVFGISVFSKDITKNKKSEEAMRQMQKLEGLGTLAGGVAHDFNNILGIILAYVSSFVRFKDDTKKLDLAVATITKAVDRGKTLVQQILTFARKTETAFGAVDVNDVVMEIMTMIYETFPKVITYSQNFDKTIHYINADRSQLHQALLNLCVNARDAMPKGGMLTINTRMVSVAHLRGFHPDAAESSYVCIEVSDTGEGMSEETQKRIFEPFFTTKGIGKGTGLGLAVVFGVAQTHKGFIDVESKLGKGTTFRLYLPASQAAVPVIENDEQTLEEIPGGTETLLVVEDEEMLMMPLQLALADKGYKILVAGDGLTALKIFKENKNKINLVLTDLGLPNMSGLEVCRKIKEINPKEYVILATGFLDPGMKAEFLEVGIDHFLFKPYDLKKVLKMVREVLDEK